MDLNWLLKFFARLASAFKREESKRGGNGFDARAFARELAKAEKTTKRKGAQAGLNAVASAFRAAIRDSFGLGYEFTYEELECALEQKRLRQELKQGLRSAAEKLIDAEYSGKELTKEEVIALSQEMKKVLRIA